MCMYHTWAQINNPDGVKRKKKMYGCNIDINVTPPESFRLRLNADAAQYSIG